MTLKNILDLRLVKDDTKIYVRPAVGLGVLACGNWFQDNVLHYIDAELECFTWQDDNKIYLDLK